ncbi:GspH/FimT family pseudopilin [Ectothiorhodospiraceae bacterium WFHF3C12]|nr:GspH/FimT family pseudopilin [Ectothiorhodospiraceae bacterium WFHF3C12]
MKTNTGFTLIELMITLAVAAVVLTLGAPGMMNLVRDNRLTSNTNEVIAALTVARSEAIKSGQIITVCGSSDQSNCNSTSWEDGWLVFRDTDGDAVRDAGETILRVQSPLEGMTIRLTSFDGAAADTGNTSRHIQYASSGFLREADDGSLFVCDTRGAAEGRSININVTGRPAMGQDSNSDGTVEDVNGAEMTCP